MDPPYDFRATAVRDVHVHEHHVRCGTEDPLDGRNHIARLADDLDLLFAAALAVDLVTDTGAKELMVVNDEQTQPGRT